MGEGLPGARATLALIKEICGWQTLLSAEEAPEYRADAARQVAQLIEAGFVKFARLLQRPLGETIDRTLLECERLVGTATHMTPPAFGAMPTNRINAIAALAPNGEPFCICDVGLTSYMSVLSEAIAEMTEWGGQRAGSRTQGWKLLWASVAQCLCIRDARVVTTIERRRNLSSTSLVMNGYLELAMCLFVFLHETAHHALGHTGSTEEVTLSGPAGEYLLNSIRRSREQEFAADRFAFEAFQPLMRGEEADPFPPWCDCAPLMLLDGLSLAELLQPPSPLSTHPTSRERWLALRDLADVAVRPEGRKFYVATREEMQLVLEAFQEFRARGDTP